MATPAHTHAPAKIAAPKARPTGVVASVPRPATPTVQHAMPRAARCACGGVCPHCREEKPGVRPKLPISQPGDSSEREADQIAEQIMRAKPSPGPADAEVNAEGVQLARLPATSSPAAPTAAPAAVHDTLRSQGQPLGAETRRSLEPQFGTSFAHVRVHADRQAADSAESVNAQAYTVGHHVVFNSGRYAPHTSTGRRLLAHELTHVVQQSHSGTSALQRDAKKDPDCDPNNLERLGPNFHKPANEVEPFSKSLGLKLQEMQLGNPVAGEKNFVLFCPHRSTVPLNPLVPCTTVFKILNGNRPEPGKVGAWVQQPGKSELFWGFVKENLLSTSGCHQPNPSPVGPPPNAPAVREPAPVAPDTDSPAPDPDEAQAVPEFVPPSVGTGMTMRINAPDDPGWAKVRPMYLWFSFGEPFFLPHFLKVTVRAKYKGSEDIFWVNVDEGRYEGHDVMIDRKNLQADSGSPGYAETSFDVATGEFYYGGQGPIEAASSIEKSPALGVHDLLVPDFPHDKAVDYGPMATSWFLIDGTSDKYLHPGMVSLGCATIRIKMGDTTTWPKIWSYLIDGRKDDGVVGTITITNSMVKNVPPPMPGALPPSHGDPPPSR